jgi:uncharacterized protein YpmS
MVIGARAMSERSSNESDNPAPAEKPRTWRKRIWRAALLTLLALAVAVGVVIYLAKSEPEYWKQHERFLAETSPQKMAQLAGQVQDRLDKLANLGLDGSDPATRALQALTGQGLPGGILDTQDAVDDGSGQPRVKPENVHINTEQTLTLNNEELAAVVKLRLDEWMKERGYVKPEEVKDPLIAVEDNELVMAFKFNAGKLSAVISGKFNVTVLENGMAELSLKRFLVGKLPVPADAIADHLREKTGGDARAAKVGEWLSKLKLIEIKPVLELEHRRRARVMAYKVQKNSLELTVRIQDHKTYKAMNQALAGVPVD